MCGLQGAYVVGAIPAHEGDPPSTAQHMQNALLLIWCHPCKHLHMTRDSVSSCYMHMHADAAANATTPQALIQCTVAAKWAAAEKG